MSGPLLITGGSGWAGRALLRGLTAGLADGPQTPRELLEAPIRCLVPDTEPSDVLEQMSPRIRLVPGDLRDEQASQRLVSGAAGGVLFHIAGVIHPRRVAEFYEVNVEAALHLFGAAARAEVKRAVVVSSNSPIGVNPHPDHLFDEDSQYRPYLNYGRSKMLLELVALRFHREAQMEIVVIRPPWFYGPDQPARQSLFFRMVRTGRVPIVGGGNNRRSMVYTDNLAQGLMLAAVTPRASGEVFWIADAQPYSMNEIVDTIEEALGEDFGLQTSGRRIRLPGLVSRTAFAADWLLQRLGLYHQKLHVLSEMNKTIACRIDTASRVLGYEPRVALREGMRRSIASSLANGHEI